MLPPFFSSFAAKKMVDSCEKKDFKEEEKFTFFFNVRSPFSQFHYAKFTVNGLHFNCAEQYYAYRKAMTFGDVMMAEKIMKTSNPRMHKEYGRLIENFNDDVWLEVCRKVVKEGNRAKFTQNPHLKKELLNTKGTTLVETNPNDCRWGIGLHALDPKSQKRSMWRGSNWLGEILTDLRDELEKEELESTKKMTDKKPNIQTDDDCNKETDDDRKYIDVENRWRDELEWFNHVLENINTKTEHVKEMERKKSFHDLTKKEKDVLEKEREKFHHNAGKQFGKDPL